MGCLPHVMSSSYLSSCHLFLCPPYQISRVDKKRDKMERKVLDSQERAFWDVHRPVPGCVNTTEMDIKKLSRINRTHKKKKVNELNSNNLFYLIPAIHNLREAGCFSGLNYLSEYAVCALLVCGVTLCLQILVNISSF